MLKKIKKTMLVLFLTAAGSFLNPVSAAPESIYGVVSFVSGEAWLINADGKKETAKVGAKILPLDRLTTGATGILRVQIADIFLCHIEKNSSVIFEEIVSNTEYDKLKLSLKSGQVMSKLISEKKLKKSQLTIQTPTITAGVRGTSFMVSEKNGSKATKPGNGDNVPTGVYVSDGEVAVESNDGKFKLSVNAGEQAQHDKKGLIKSLLEDAYATRMKILEELKIQKEFNCKLIEEQKEKNRKLLEEFQ